MVISERVFRLMKERGINQKEFSERTGIAQSTISDWKHKKTNPSADKIMIICDVLEVSPYELLQEEPSKREVDCIITSKGTGMYDILVELQDLPDNKLERIRGYIEALKAVK